MVGFVELNRAPLPYGNPLSLAWLAWPGEVARQRDFHCGLALEAPEALALLRPSLLSCSEGLANRHVKQHQNCPTANCSNDRTQPNEIVRSSDTSKQEAMLF